MSEAKMLVSQDRGTNFITSHRSEILHSLIFIYLTSCDPSFVRVESIYLSVPRSGRPILQEVLDPPLAKCRGGSRILRKRVRHPSREGAQTYDFGKFSEKLHEIENILYHGGVCREHIT